ncbi:hypothetical protein EYB53_024255 [Candidatus Chloroploca sp. M-50]|uniref:Alpha/beta hydrolase n=1 Tax=Candidatus Chloroploca mongolica TaxID=2528176 RepID=A0ABS4DHB6_9CHLR|nr:hypothetical protein [Candidatus Chloroploca mongolica]MBP1468846.1 hypothetical protein [Candidatus Chloroploca mongolica]
MLALLLFGALALLAVSLALAPLEALGWWAGWFGNDHELEAAADALRERQGVGGAAARHYVVFLSGVGSPRSGEVPEEERPFIAHLRAHLPDTVVVDGVLPYSVLGLSLDHPARPLGRLWHHAIGRGGFWQQLINTRNLFQVLVSADRRYGPVISFGLAKQILIALVRHGYVIDSGVPITLVGSSGGGQMGLGTGPFLAQALHVPVRMVSLGGVMSGDPAILSFRHFDHLYGTKDPVATMLPQMIFPSRWPINHRSPWWEARQRGIYRERAIGPIAHTGPGGYYDGKSRLPDGTDHCTHSANEVIACIRSWESEGI